MKKIYSLLLTAAALLVGTNAWAQHTISLEYYGGAKADQTFATLQEAIDYVNPGDSATITLTGPQLLEKGIMIPHLSDADTVGKIRIANIQRQRICINLNGQNIKTKPTCNDACFALIKGVLRLTGGGTVERDKTLYYDGGNWDRGAIVVSGTDGMKDDYTGTWPNNTGNGKNVNIPSFCRVDRSKQEWSTLYIDNGVTVTSERTGTYGIGVQDIGGSFPDYYGDFPKDYLGYSCLYVSSTAKDASELPLWNVGTGKEAWSSFGVKIIIDGTVYGERRGINVLGSINQTPGTVENTTSRRYNAYPYYDHYFPYVKIGKNAEVYCSPNNITDDGNGGIYLGGWAVIDIEGVVHGQTGIMAKAGDVLIYDGQVFSDDNSTDARVDGWYHGTVNGSGVFVTSDPGYAGETNLTIAGDSKVSGAGGSAIIDVIGGGTQSTVSHVTITGGTIEGGQQGAINLTTQTSAQNVTQVTGGTVDGTVSVSGTTVDVSDLVPTTGGYHTTTVTTDNGTVIVVSQGQAPTPGNTVVGATSNTSVKWQNTDTKAETLNADKTLNEVEINESYIQTLTIAANKTFTVDRLILGANARIIVEAGAKLIVKGEQGIVAPVVENIELRSSESAQAVLLFHPDVTSNRHPNATVKLTSKGYVKNGDYNQKVWQRFGVPAYTSKVEKGAVTRKSTNKIEYNDAGWIAAYDYSQDDWVTMPDADAFVPFQCYAASSIATEPNHTVYTFTCPLMGNTDFALPLNAYTDWNYYANSYMAPIDIRQMLTTFVNSNANVRGTVYVYRSEDNWWDNINLASGYFGAPQTTIDPMQAFIFQKREEGTADAVISYKNHIYNPDPTTTPVAAPARSNEVFSAAIIEIAAADGAKDKLYLIESDKFSADFDNGYDATKYMNNESFNLFAGEQLGMIATDNLEGTAISMTTKAQTSFTMTFSNVTNMEYAVRDMLTGTETAIVEGATYMFSTAANANVEGRFQIVPVAKMPTAIENIEETAAVKGIYTITGQFVGNDYHSLQNGVYVVDGKKIVK